jgi:hypothetical protein
MMHSHHLPAPRGGRALAMLALALLTWMAGLAVPDALAAPARPVGQAAPPLPPTVDLDAIAAQVAALHRANGGATVNLYRGDLAGEDLYVVDVYPELSEAVAGPDIDPAQIRQFINAHLSRLTDSRNNVGTWFNEADGYTYLAVSTALPDRAQAIALGQQYDQIGVFDLSRMTMIELGGTGTPPPNLPPIDQRLPPGAGEVAP